MGKIEDMRRQREQQFADAAQREAKAAKAAPVAPPSTPAPKPAARGEVTTTSSKRGASKAATDEQGKCPDCGKTKPLANGVMASHQKGFGKACSGSRKPPA